MGCFGDMTPTEQKQSFGNTVSNSNVTGQTSSTTGAPQWVQDAGQVNYNQARGVLDAGFQPYTGQMVAPLSGNEQQASSLVSNLASTGNPYTGYSQQAYQTSGQTPAYQYGFNTIVDPNGPLGSVNSYMNPYLDAVLAPQLRQLGISGAQARNQIGAGATQAGAYGDARHGIEESQQFKNQAQQETDVVGSGFGKAYDTAMQQRQADAAREFQTQQQQQQANEQQLARLRQSGIDLTGLDQSNVQRGLGLASALEQTGGTERGVQQAQDTAQQQEFMRQQGFTDQQIQFLTQVLAGTPTAKTTTGQTGQTGYQTQTGQQNSITSKPDNTGWQALGSLASAAFLA